DNQNPQGTPGGTIQNGGDFTSPGSYDPRQWQREFRERLNEIRDIQNGLGRNDPVSRELEQVAGAIQGVMNSKGADHHATERMAEQILDPPRGSDLEL